HDLQGFQGSRGPDALGPEGAADKGSLRRLHDLASAYGCSNGISVAQRLAEHRHIRLNSVFLVQSAECLAETRCALVKDQHDAPVCRQLSDLFEKTVFRSHVA